MLDNVSFLLLLRVVKPFHITVIKVHIKAVYPQHEDDDPAVLETLNEWLQEVEVRPRLEIERCA